MPASFDPDGRTHPSEARVAYSRDVVADEGAETATRASTRPEPGADIDAALMRARVLARMFAEDEPLPQIDRFELLEELGRGGMGRVYLAYDPRLERKIALKRLLADRAEPNHGRHLVREAQGLARLAHPNVVSVFEVGQGAAGVWIAMEYVPGQTLTRWLETPRTWRAIVEVLIAAGRGLAAAHAVDLIHRDFKPSNVIVGDDGRTRVLDFGLAAPIESLAERERGAPTQRDLARGGSQGLASAISGTPAYMPPEAFGEGELGPQSDQWAFCVTAYEALFGRRPFTGSTLHELVAAIRDAPPAAIDPRSRVPTKLVDVIVRGLAKRPRDRWPTMAALLDELEDRLRPRRLIWPVSLAIGIAGVSVALALNARAIDPCPIEEGGLAGAWDDQVRARLEARFAESTLPQAGAAGAVVVGELGGWASEWASTRRGACVATRIEGVASDALFDERIDCLARRREALEGMLDAMVLASPDALVQGSVELIAGLPELESCAGQPSQRLPSDPAHATRVLAGYRELERARTLGHFGALEDASAGIERLIGAPGLADHLPFVIEARLRRATLAFETESSDAAIDALHSVALAAAGEGLDALELDARLTLAQEVVDRGRLELGAWLIDEARVGLPARGPAAARSSWTQARLAQHRGQLDLAIAGFERTLELDPRLATRAVLLDIGNAHAERGELELARAAYERAEAAVLASWGPKSASAARVELAFGNLALQAGSLPEARARLEAADTILAAASPGPSSLRAGIADSLAKLAMNEGDLAEAARHVEQAIAELEQLGELDTPQAAASVEALGVIRYFAGDLDGSIAAYERALTIERGVFGDAHWRVGLTRSNLGESLLALDRREPAELQFREALAILERSLASDDARLALPLKGLGSIALAEGHFELAGERFERALALVDASGEPQELADLRFALARTLRGAGVDAARAAALAEQARAGFDALGFTDRRDAVAAWLDSP